MIYKVGNKKKNMKKKEKFKCLLWFKIVVILVIIFRIDWNSFEYFVFDEIKGFEILIFLWVFVIVLWGSKF